MATNLEIDENLIKEALELGGHPTKDAVVEEALREYVQRRKQLKILELFGTIEYYDDYDYKQQRRSGCMNRPLRDEHCNVHPISYLDVKIPGDRTQQ